MNLLAGDAVLLASDIQDNQALLSLDISNTSLAMDVESDHDIGRHHSAQNFCKSEGN